MRVRPRLWKNKETRKEIEIIPFVNMAMGHDIAAWAGGTFHIATNPLKQKAYIEIVSNTKNVQYRAYPGDYIAKDPETETSFVISSEIFQHDYEIVD